MKLPFDHIRVGKPGAPQDRMTIEAYLALELEVRIGYLLAGKLHFYDGDKPVERKVALAALREMAKLPARP